MIWPFRNWQPTFLAPRRLPVVRQRELSDCGISCLSAIMQSYGMNISLSDLKLRFSTSLQGSTLLQLMKMARELGASSRGVAFSMDQVRHLALPAIVHWNKNHYVVLERIRGSTLDIMDPAIGRITCTLQEFAVNATGYALEVGVDRVFRQRDSSRPLRFQDFIFRNPGTWSHLRASLLLTLIIEAALLAGPFLVQLVVDEGITKNNPDILSLLIITFGVVALWDTGARFIRGQLHVTLATRLHNDAKIGLVSRLLSLPFDWFERRGVSQIYQRLRQIDLLQTTLSESTFSTLLDGAFSLISLAVMFMVSPLLTGISLTALVICIASREVMLHTVRRNMTASLVTASKAEGELLRTIDSIQTIKLNTAEATALNRWSNMQSDASRERLGIQIANYWFALFDGTVRHAERLGVLYLGAVFALRGEMSLGTVFAYLMFRDQFLDKALGCTQTIYGLRQAGVVLDELRDVVDAPVEVIQAGFSSGDAPIDAGGELTFENVGFAYASFAEPVLREVNVVIRAGDKVAITGMSGSGKSTFLKILTSLYSPTTGTFRVSGVDLRRMSVSAYRRQIAVLDSKATFLTASILDNIFFESESHDAAWAIECARNAGLHEDILQQPGGYATLMTPSGDSLSSGQKQRLMIARALYTRPRLLVLDEPTAHLDAAAERAVIEHLLTLDSTVLVVTHSPAVVSSFASVLEVDQGQIKLHREPTDTPGTAARTEAKPAAGSTSAIAVETPA